MRHGKSNHWLHFGNRSKLPRKESNPGHPVSFTTCFEAAFTQIRLIQLTKFFNPNHAESAECITEIGFNRKPVWTLGPMQGAPCIWTPERSGRTLCICLLLVSSTTLVQAQLSPFVSIGLPPLTLHLQPWSILYYPFKIVSVETGVQVFYLPP